MKAMWEILVPTEKRVPTLSKTGEERKFYHTRYHKVWDDKVRAISGGLTIMSPVKGQWMCPQGNLFRERMIPVRIIATEEEINKIVDMTLVYYDQLAVLCYKISDTVILRERK
jgi:hypothetical protein